MTQPPTAPSARSPQARSARSMLNDVIRTDPSAPDKDGLSAVIYGESGSGKTTSIATLEKPLVLYTEHNLKSLRRTGADYLPIQTWDDLLRAQLSISDAMRRGSFPYSAVVWDSISASEALIIQGIAKKEIPKIQDWQLVKARVRTLLLNGIEWCSPVAYEKPIDFVVIAGLDRYVVEGTGELIIAPDVPGRALRTVLFRLVDCVFYSRVSLGRPDVHTGVRTATYEWLTSSEPPYIAKDGTAIMDKVSPQSFALLKERWAARGVPDAPSPTEAPASALAPKAPQQKESS